MTEASFTQARKLMQQLNHLRGKITCAKNNVSRWTHAEMLHRENLEPAKAANANRMLLRAIQELDKYKAMFAAIQFPPADLPPIKDAKYCRICQQPIAQQEQYCLTCDTNQNIPKYDFKNTDDKGFFE